MAERNIKVKLTERLGEDGKPGFPLLMANGQTVDPTNEWTVRLVAARAKAKRLKTAKAQADADRIEFLSALYTDAEGYAVLPIQNFLKAIIQSAKMERKGKQVESGVYVTGGSRLSFNGSGSDKKAAELVGLPEYTHRQRTKRGVVAVRPMFSDWSCEYAVTYDDTIIDPEVFMDILTRAGKVGIGSWKARYGKFDVEVTEDEPEN